MPQSSQQLLLVHHDLTMVLLYFPLLCLKSPARLHVNKCYTASLCLCSGNVPFGFTLCNASVPVSSFTPSYWLAKVLTSAFSVFGSNV